MHHTFVKTRRCQYKQSDSPHIPLCRRVIANNSINTNLSIYASCCCWHLSESPKSLFSDAQVQTSSPSHYSFIQLIHQFVLPLFIIFLLQTPQLTNAENYNIGAIFPRQTPPSLSQMAFEFACAQINQEASKIVLDAKPAGSSENPIFFYPVIRNIDIDNSFEASQAACDLISVNANNVNGVAGILAPPSTTAAAVVQDIGDTFEIPIIHYSKQFQSSNIASLYLNLYPHYTTTNTAIANLIDYYNWTSFAILYENEASLRTMEDLLRVPRQANSSVIAWKLQTGDKLWEILKEFRTTGRNRVVVDTHPNNLRELLTKLEKMQMLTEYHHYIFTSYELLEYNISDYTHGDMNVTAFCQIDYDSVVYDLINQAFCEWLLGQERFKRMQLNCDRLITLEVGLIRDAVYALKKGLESAAKAQQILPRDLSCSMFTTWNQGFTLLNYLRMIEQHNFLNFAELKSFATVTGVTGTVKWNGLGHRVGVFTQIFERRTNKQLEMVGNWTLSEGPNITQLNNTVSARELLRNKTLIVTTIESMPFAARKSSENKLQGNEQFEGYCVDLLEQMKEYLKKENIEFKYTIRLVKDSTYGSRGQNGVWNGMVGELMRGEADLAVAPLTINSLRQDVIDFSTPFMNLGISILYRLQENKTPSIFSFLKPLHYDIWMYLIVSYVAISMVLFVMARFTPYEWYNPSPDSDEVENQFTLMNALWFSAGAMMQQGSEITPRALSTRIVTGTWWFFVLICIASYTANLAAFLTVTRMESPIKSAEDLAAQNNIKYGSVDSGSTKQFFEYSEIPTFVRMWQFMANQEPSVFVASTAAGIQRVMDEDYAFLMESTMLEYVVSQKCNLTQIGGLLDSKYYGIGLKKGSPYTGIVSKAILQMQDDGVLVKMKKKWWEDASKCISRDSKSGTDDASSLKLDSIGGIFYVLIMGTMLGVIIAFIEFIWKSRQNAAADKLPLWKEMFNELAFAFRCRGKKSPPADDNDLYKTSYGKSRELHPDENGMDDNDCPRFAKTYIPALPNYHEQQKLHSSPPYPTNNTSKLAILQGTPTGNHVPNNRQTYSSQQQLPSMPAGVGDQMQSFGGTPANVIAPAGGSLPSQAKFRIRADTNV